VASAAPPNDDVQGELALFEPARAQREQNALSPLASPVGNNGFFAGFDEDEPPRLVHGPGDSHYELAVSFEDVIDELGDEWATTSVLVQGHSASSARPGASKVSRPDPWYYKTIDSLSRFQFFVVWGFGGLALLLFVLLLVRTWNGGTLLESIPSLVVGFVGTVAFLLVSSTIMALNLLLADLARNLRKLKDHAD
jgi:hypothetical protein